MLRRLRQRIPRWVKLSAAALSVATVLFIIVALISGWTAFGTKATGARLERMQASPQWDEDHFVNPQPLWNDVWGMFTGLLTAEGNGSPEDPLPVQTVDPAMFDTPPDSGVRITWLGHSTIIIEIDGHIFLTDPLFGGRVSPLSWLGPTHWYDPPIALEDLPPLDAVILSHDHYDHLDYPTIVAMKDWDTRFITPLGVGAHLEYWGVPGERIEELDWWETTTIGDLTLACTPARHASGRMVPYDQDATLWSGWAFLGTGHRVFFSGDTGLFPAMQEIGDRYGPFDLTMIEAGAYDQAWPDWHIGPEQAIRAHGMLRGRVFLPVHWGLVNLAYHNWTEPIERSIAAATAAGATIVAPRPGESFDPLNPAPIERWWPDVPWRTADDYPIVSTKVDD